MTKEELVQAARVLHRISQIKSYVSKERFAMVANTRFGISDERKLDVMYGLLNLTPKLIAYIAIADDEGQCQGYRIPDYVKLIPQAIEIAESAYELLPTDWDAGHVPSVEYNRYRKSDKRRYFYIEGKQTKTIDISLHSREDIILLSELLQREGIKMYGVAEHLGYLEGQKTSIADREQIQYFDGDIYFLYGDVTDRIFYDWYSCGNDAGVYVATKDGWRKLLYTPGRGYINKQGEIEYEDDDHFYSDYKLEKSGMKFQYVGNTNFDCAVLMERKPKVEKLEEEE